MFLIWTLIGPSSEILYSSVFVACICSIERITYNKFITKSLGVHHEVVEISDFVGLVNTRYNILI